MTTRRPNDIVERLRPRQATPSRSRRFIAVDLANWSASRPMAFARATSTPEHLRSPFETQGGELGKVIEAASKPTLVPVLAPQGRVLEKPTHSPSIRSGTRCLYQCVFCHHEVGTCQHAAGDASLILVLAIATLPLRKRVSCWLPSCDGIRRSTRVRLPGAQQRGNRQIYGPGAGSAFGLITCRRAFRVLASRTSFLVSAVKPLTTSQAPLPLDPELLRGGQPHRARASSRGYTGIWASYSFWRPLSRRLKSRPRLAQLALGVPMQIPGHGSSSRTSRPSTTRMSALPMPPGASASSIRYGALATIRAAASRKPTR